MLNLNLASLNDHNILYFVLNIHIFNQNRIKFKNLIIISESLLFNYKDFYFLQW